MHLMRGRAITRLLSVVLPTAALLPCGAFAASVEEPDPARQGRVYFIAPDGEDDADGSKEHPFATIERVQRTIRQLKTNGKFPSGGVTVFIRGGRYPMAPGLAFDEYDSGEPGSPVTWRSCRGEKPVFDGGWRVPELKPVSDPAALERIPPAARDHVRCCDVKAAGYALDAAPPPGARRGAAASRMPVDLYGDGVGLPQARNADGHFQCPVEKPGEWHLDFASGVLYVWPPEGCRELVLSDFADTFLEATKLHDVRFGGLTFEYGRWDAVTLTRCRNIVFTKNTIRNFGRHGVTANASRDMRITGNTLSGFGGIGMRCSPSCSEMVVSGNTVLDGGAPERAGGDVNR